MKLHTAFTYTVEESCRGGLNIILRELLEISFTKPPAPPEMLFGKELDTKKEVRLYMASHNTIERVCSHMDSLTDDLIYHQWFKVKERKQKKVKTTT